MTRMALVPVVLWLGLGGGVLAPDGPRQEAGGGNSPARIQCSRDTRMVRVPAGTVLLGEDGEGREGRSVEVPEFWIDSHEVTNGQFAAFVAATGYVTEAEREGGSAVFVPPPHWDGSLDSAQWWRFRPGASWRHPEGPESTIDGKDWYPVVHVTFADAAAYARWKGAELPDVVQWERAARAEQRAGRDPLSWAFDAQGRPIANTWQGIFPMRDTGQDRHTGIAPVGCFQANSLGVRDMIGNVWEWTRSSAPSMTGSRLLKGGSYLCSMNYCANFRAAAFQAQEQDLGASHIGFRTVRRAPPSPVAGKTASMR